MKAGSKTRKGSRDRQWPRMDEGITGPPTAPFGQPRGREGLSSASLGRGHKVSKVWKQVRAATADFFRRVVTTQASCRQESQTSLSPELKKPSPLSKHQVTSQAAGLGLYRGPLCLTGKHHIPWTEKTWAQHSLTPLKLMSLQPGSESKGTCCQVWWHELIPRSHKVEGEN